MKERLIMIPGTLCDAALFQYQTRDLSDIADCEVANHSSSDDLKAVAANILKAVEGDFSIMGLSYGGIIAFEIWRQAPQRIKRLILMNTNHKAPSEKARTTQQRFVGMAYLGEFREITTHFLKDTLLHPDHAKSLEIREIVLQMALNIGRDAFVRQVKAQLARPDSTTDLPNIKCPTLIITGAQDDVCPVFLHQEMADLIPNATLKIMGNCGHLSTLEQPEIVNECVREWWLSQT
jgi:pimeloyl-ACP methyl ester carboxylesterase